MMAGCCKRKANAKLEQFEQVHSGTLIVSGLPVYLNNFTDDMREQTV